MPVTWKFREAILMLRVCGVVTNREVESAFAQAFAKPPAPSGLRLLWDARESQKPTVSPRPQYPQAAFDAKVQGTVLVEVLIGEEGEVAHL